MSKAIYPIRGIALIKALMSKRNSGTIETKRNTLNTRNNLASNTPDPPSGTKLPITIIVSKIFQPLLKKPFLSLVAKNRITISKTKKIVTPVSNHVSICMA